MEEETEGLSLIYCYSYSPPSFFVFTVFGHTLPLFSGRSFLLKFTGHFSLPLYCLFPFH